MKKYKAVQIIKHALMYYLERPSATDKEIEEEKYLLKQVSNEVEMLKQKFGIK